MNNQGNNPILRVLGMSNIKVSSDTELASSDKKDHFKADCYRHKAMLNHNNKSDGISLVFASFESHLVNVSLNS